MRAKEGPGGQARGRAKNKSAHKSFPEGMQREGPRREEFEKLEGDSRTYSRLVTDVSAMELRLGIEGRVRPVEDKIWPPCWGQDRGQKAISWRVAQTVKG